MHDAALGRTLVPRFVSVLRPVPAEVPDGASRLGRMEQGVTHEDVSCSTGVGATEARACRRSNDSDEEVRDIARFLVSVSPDIPWHVTAFHPDHKMSDRDGTPARTLIRAAEIGLAAGSASSTRETCPGAWPASRTPTAHRVGRA